MMIACVVMGLLRLSLVQTQGMQARDFGQPRSRRPPHGDAL
jgi:hypothetical protein